MVIPPPSSSTEKNSRVEIDLKQPTLRAIRTASTKTTTEDLNT